MPPSVPFHYTSNPYFGKVRIDAHQFACYGKIKFIWFHNLIHLPSRIYCVVSFFTRDIAPVSFCTHPFPVFSRNTQHTPQHNLENRVFVKSAKVVVLQWRHNKHNGVSNHRRLACLLKRLYRLGSKKTAKPRVTGLCKGNPPVTGGSPLERASNAENVFIWWPHNVYSCPVIPAGWPLL